MNLKALDESSTLLAQKRGEFNEAFKKYAAKKLEEAEKAKEDADAEPDEVMLCHTDPNTQYYKDCVNLYQQKDMGKKNKKQQADKNLKIKQAVKKAADLDDENAIVVAKNDLLSTIDSKSSAYVDLDQESQDLKVSIERYLESIEQKNTETKNAESAQEALDKQNEFFYGECLMTKTEDNDSIFFQQSESESEILVLGSPSVIEESDYTVRS